MIINDNDNDNNNENDNGGNDGNFDKDGWDCIDKMTLMQITRHYHVRLSVHLNNELHQTNADAVSQVSAHDTLTTFPGHEREGHFSLHPCGLGMRLVRPVRMVS